VKNDLRRERQDSREAAVGRVKVVARCETFGEGNRDGERSRDKCETRETNGDTVRVGSVTCRCEV